MIFFWNSSFAINLSMDNLFQKFSQLGTTSSPEHTSQTDAQWNLFQQTLQSQSSQKTQALLQTLTTVTTSITTKAAANNYSCALKKSDVITILSQTDTAFVHQLYLQGAIPLSTSIIQSWSSLLESCNRFLHCEGLDRDKNSDEIWQIENCKDSISQQFIINNILRNNVVSLPNNNINDNIFSDGLANGLFDIIIDINNVKKILFKQTTDEPPTPKIVFYQIPSVIIPQDDGFSDNTTIPWSIFWLSTIPNDTNQYSQLPSWNINNPDTTNTNTATWWQSSWSNNLSQFLQDIHSNNSTNSQSSSDNLQDIPTAIVNSSLCPISWQESQDSSLNTPDITIDSTWWDTSQLDQLYQIQDDLINALSGFIYTTSWSDDWQQWSSVLSNIIKTDSAVPSTTPACKATCSDTEGMEKLICEGKCCINSCNKISSPKEKIVCLSQCACGEINVSTAPKSFAYDMLRVKICRIPAQPAHVSAGKTITSVEEVVEEINQIFNKLKQDGLLSKRSKTKEFMDSSFSNIKFSQILAFDIFVAIKPIYDKLQMAQQKQKVKHDHNILAQINPFINEARWEGADKNKYLIVWDSQADTETLETSEKNCQVWWFTYDPLLKKCNTSSQTNTTTNLLNNLSKINTSAITQDSYYTFWKETYTTWQEIYTAIYNIQSISLILKNKAEKAPN